ncbi:uncharacterized membrane protein YhaH (DUF805 family) [Vreelandella songnenensis]|uniref:Uncharacterized membrane protein YhaH (DUF805 family) n=1 Tax=Vreelandella songnenensis TaxID=1176243 RepID=A0A2T0V4X0_9GAMM|nr:DUF805 domain-containing protein [Halomonas songnenensis]PRY65229.1 uncharacterized membrane protein YhaH (DUF805 family) [Halomonas songnenensis]
MNLLSKTSIHDSNRFEHSGSKLDILDSRGRLGRVRFLTYSLIILTIWATVNSTISVVLQLYYPSWSDVLDICMIFFSVIALVLAMIVCKRRLNDFNTSGWWLLIFFVPIAFPILLLLMLFMPGTSGENRFGATTIKNSNSIYIALFLLVALFSLVAII